MELLDRKPTVLPDARSPSPAGPFRNALLRALNSDVIARLHLRPVTLEVEHEIEFPGSLIQHVYFIEAGMASMTTTFKNGSQVEVGMFGYKSAIGVSALMGSKRSLNRVYTQIAGHGYASPVEDARMEFLRGEDFQRLALGYVQAQLVQVIQLAGCNATHSFEQRLARWLLVCEDRAQCDTFRMSHEFLSNMLGCTRSTMSIAAAQLKRAKLIEYTRGVIHILDAKGLEKKACECYAVVENYLDSYAQFDGGLPEQPRRSGIAS
jgi:CRP-like cAMP-binding protein